LFGGTNQVIRDAVVAAKNRGSDQTKEFLGLGRKRAGFIGLVVESEKALDAEMAAAENLFVEVGASTLEVVK
jgi:hypothetical protein